MKPSTSSTLLKRFTEIPMGTKWSASTKVYQRIIRIWNLGYKREYRVDDWCSANTWCNHPQTDELGCFSQQAYVRYSIDGFGPYMVVTLIRDY